MASNIRESRSVVEISKNRSIDLYWHDVLVADNLSMSDIVDLRYVADCTDDGGL